MDASDSFYVVHCVLFILEGQNVLDRLLEDRGEETTVPFIGIFQHNLVLQGPNFSSERPAVHLPFSLLAFPDFPRCDRETRNYYSDYAPRSQENRSFEQC